MSPSRRPWSDPTVTPPRGNPVVEPPGLPAGRPLDLPGRGRTFYRRQPGPPGAPTLLLLHGWTANSALNWYSSYATLSRRFDVVAIDHRGHGRGIRSRRRFRLEDCADDAVALADALGIDRFVPVGYSMGGPVAQLIWRRHPHRVEGLVLCSTARNFVGQRPGERGRGPHARPGLPGGAGHPDPMAALVGPAPGHGPLRPVGAGPMGPARRSCTTIPA